LAETTSAQTCPNCKNPVERYLDEYCRCPNCNIILSSEKGKTQKVPLEESKMSHPGESHDSFEVQIYKMKNKLRVAGAFIFLTGIPLLLTQSLLSFAGVLLIILGLYFILG
jgi:predicted amidophosphoribosyltransferase